MKGGFTPCKRNKNIESAYLFSSLMMMMMMMMTMTMMTMIMMEKRKNIYNSDNRNKVNIKQR